MTDSTKRRDELAEAYTKRFTDPYNLISAPIDFKAGFEAGRADSAEEIEKLTKQYKICSENLRPNSEASTWNYHLYTVEKSRAEKAEAEVRLLKTEKHMSAIANTKDIYKGQYFIEAAEKLAAALDESKKLLENCDWDCCRCGKDPEMVDTDLYKVICETLAEYRKGVSE